MSELDPVASAINEIRRDDIIIAYVVVHHPIPRPHLAWSLALWAQQALERAMCALTISSSTFRQTDSKIPSLSIF